MSNVTTGSDVRVHLLHEDNGFNASPSDSTAKPLGGNPSVDQAEGTNNAVEVMEPATKTPVDIIEQAFEGAWSVTFEYTNPWWLNWVLGVPTSVDNADGSYTYTFDDANDAQSQQILIGFEESTSLRTLQGCVPATASVRPTVDGNAEITLNGAYAEEGVTSPGSLTAQPALQHDVMTFADVTLSQGGTVLGYVQNATLDLTTNIELTRELGSRISIDFIQRNLTPRVNWDKFVEAGSTSNLEDMYGGSTSVQESVDQSAAVTLTFDNGVSAGSGINKVAFNLEGTFPNTVGQSPLGDATAAVTETINRNTTGLSVDATNEQSSAK